MISKHHLVSCLDVHSGLNMYYSTQLPVKPFLVQMHLFSVSVKLIDDLKSLI